MPKGIRQLREAKRLLEQGHLDKTLSHRSILDTSPTTVTSSCSGNPELRRGARETAFARDDNKGLEVVEVDAAH
jgi:hypothetical protein